MARKAQSRQEAVRESTKRRALMQDAEQISRAIRAGEVDAFVVGTAEKAQTMLLEGADYPYRVMVDSMNEGAVTLTPDGSIFFCNPRFSEMVHMQCEQLVGSAFQDLVAPDERGAFMALLEGSGGGCSRGEFHLQSVQGTPVAVQLSIRPLEAKELQGTSIVVTDLTDRKQAEETLRESEAEFHSLAESMPQMVWIARPDGWKIYFNQQWLDYTGQTLEESYGHGWNKPFHPEDRQRAWDAWQDATKNLATYSLECRLRRADGVYRWWLVRGVPRLDAQGNVLTWFGTCTDIHELKMAEEALRNGEERFRALIENSSDAITLADTDGKAIYRSPAGYRILGEEPGSPRDESLFGLIHPDDAKDAMQLFAESLKVPAKSVNYQYRFRHADGSWRWVQGTVTNLLTLPAVGAIVINYRDVTGQKQSEERIKRQLEHLTAVSEIDRTIASSLDLHLSLSIVIAHVIKELGVDAADILLLDRAAQVLVYSAGSGFRTKALQDTRLPLGQGYAGQAGLERRMVQVADLPLHESEMSRAPGFKAEEFETYFALPLIAKGKLVGVMEAFKRTAFEPDPEWLDFLNTLAGQAAVAIDNLALFENLQRSIVDLSVAYDATIIGWSSAMDLRDKETEGHTQRVTEMCVKLARLFGLQDPDLAQIRRGGLLHDMGKMGIPDSILLKPGPLTDEEWVVMRKHPVYAFEMLSPIPYLRAALDIPYCHHEKWDGSGYPRGLKGEQIPLAARLFAVVDVWDALTSDRPYRKAWTREKALEYIRAGAGAHFDPAIVKVFLESDSLRTPGPLSTGPLEPVSATT